MLRVHVRLKDVGNLTQLAQELGIDITLLGLMAQDQWRHWRRRTTTAIVGGGALGKASESDNCDRGAY